MELREYGAVVGRRWILVAGLTAAVFLIALALALRGPVAYKAEYTLAVSIIPEPRMGPYFTYSNYYEWLTSEYLADDLSKLIESDAFAADVSEVLGSEVDPEAISDVTRARKTHRMLEVAITDSSAQRALDIASAHEQVINTRLGNYLAQLKADNGQVKIINRPTVRRATTALGLIADVGLKTLAGFLAGVGLAFLVEYFDSTVRARREIEQLFGVPVVAEIPLGRRLA